MSSTNDCTSLSDIKTKYEPGSVHLLLPTVLEEQLNPFHKLSVMEVKADLSNDGGDVFNVGGKYVKTGKKVKDDEGNFKDEEKWTEYYCPAKPLLMKIATAAGIQFNPMYTGVISEGKNVYHAKAQGAIKLPDGTYKTHYDEKIINLDDEEDKFCLEFMDKSIEGTSGKAGYEAAKLFKGKWIDIDKKYSKKGEKEKAYVIDDCDRQKFIDRSVLINMVLLRKHAPQKALTGAILRVIRALIGMKGQYTEDELKKPFVLARVNFSPDYTDPEVRKAMLTQGMSSMTNVFGNTSQITTQPVFSEPDSTLFDSVNVENDPFISDANKGAEPTEETEYENEGQPQEQQDFDNEPDEDKNPNVCQRCAIEISDRVSEYSKKKHGKYLCYKCQKGA